MINLRLPEISKEKHEYYYTEYNNEEHIFSLFKKSIEAKSLLCNISFHKSLLIEFKNLYKLLVNGISEIEKLFYLNRKIVFLIEKIEETKINYVNMDIIKNISLYLAKIINIKPRNSYLEYIRVRSKFEMLEYYTQYIIFDLKLLFYRNKIII